MKSVWYDVEDAISVAKGVAWDGCHKIYVLMDDEQVDKMVGYQYEHVITLDSASEYEMLCAVEEWFEESCSLRFVQSVRSALEGEDPNKGFTVLIEQGFGED